MPKKYYDISLEFFPGMLLYEGDPPVRIVEEKSIKMGDAYNLSVITFGSHTGTHIDAPKHFYDDGLTVDKLPLDYFIGRAKVFEVAGKDEIMANDLKNLDINKGDIILLKTRNSTLISKAEFDRSFAYISHDAASYLAEKGIKTIGFDYLSVEKYGSKTPDSHYIFLSHNIVILEGLVLENVSEGEYELVALPIKIKDGNGSPVRAVLIKED